MKQENTNNRRLEDLIDVSQYHILRGIKRKYDKKLIVDQSGILKMNSTFINATDGRLFSVAFRDDFKEVVMLESIDGEVRFAKSGHTKDMDIMTLMKKKKLPKTLEYIIDWDEERDVWIGKLNVSSKE